MYKLHIFISLFALVGLWSCSSNNSSEESQPEDNLAQVATPSGSFGLRGGSLPYYLSDGETPNDVYNGRGGNSYRFRFNPESGWVQYEWIQPVATKEVSLYWWNYGREERMPQGYQILYWDVTGFKSVTNARGLGLENGKYNVTSFDEITTTKLRIEVDSVDRFVSPLVEWKVTASENSKPYPPVVDAGIDRSVIVGGKTYLSGATRSLNPVVKTIWQKKSGPGKVTFENKNGIETTATFSEPGEYILTLTAKDKKLRSSSDLVVKATLPPPEKRLDVVYTKHYSIDNPLWNNRAKALIVNWIPHCIEYIERTDLESGQGGLDNFIEAAKALRGEPHGRHKGYVFSNAWVHQTIESMCIALMVDAQGDSGILAAQEKMKKTLDKWIPIILAAQEPDGYLQTAYTLRDTARWHGRWEPDARGNHEGYVAGYFIESAINHYTLTNGTDKRLYNAAKKLADCWVTNIGPGKKAWYDGHQEMEQALVRFGRFVNDMEGNGKGDEYIKLAKFLLDNRGGGSEYDQSHVPVQQQYEAVGHAVRAMYSYSGMADVAAETGDVDYESAVMSLWDNLINKKYYVTGGIGSGETSEGFGPNYSLRHNAYCESCSSCGLIFFDYKMNIAYHDAKYADLYEETMYNALLGSIDIEGNNFTYTNPLTSNHKRYPWHVCPCCVGNIPRTLLMVPTWTYVKGNSSIYVNLFIGSTITVENVNGTNVTMKQETKYPWDGKVSITVNPEESKELTIYIRVPNRKTSEIYSSAPKVSGLNAITVNGTKIDLPVENGYVAIERKWNSGDKIDFEIPMEVQRITSDDKIEANRGEIALRYGPLIYCVEKNDQDINKEMGSESLKPVWENNLLGGMMVLKGKWADGSSLMAIPYYARNNRGEYAEDDHSDKSIVWIKGN